MDESMLSFRPNSAGVPNRLSLPSADANETRGTRGIARSANFLIDPANRWGPRCFRSFAPRETSIDDCDTVSQLLESTRGTISRALPRGAWIFVQ